MVRITNAATLYVAAVLATARASSSGSLGQSFCSSVPVSERQDCKHFDEQSCVAGGCCWSPWTGDDSGTVPWCYSPDTLTTAYYALVDGYVLDDTGLMGTLKANDAGTDALGADIPTLDLKISFDDDNMARVLITDADDDDRWMIPESIVPATVAQQQPRSKRVGGQGSLGYTLTFTQSPFTFTLTRNSDGSILFSSAPQLIFKDQYLELSTSLDADSSLFGVGESTRSDMVLKPGTTYTLWARDMPAAVFDSNLYGSHPFFLELDKASGNARGAFLRNSNGMDGVYSSGGDALTFKVIGGVIDLFVFTGPSPAAVAAQYTALVGRPAMMPYWSLGYHQCKYGYATLAEVEDVQANFSAAAIPLDTVWMDIDYMSEWRDWTYDPVNFPPAQVKDFVDGLHDGGQRFVVIVDPGILKVDDSWNQSYAPYEDGLEMGIFVEDGFTGEPYMSQVWPGPTVMPDWLHPNASSYWQSSIKDFYDVVAFDGLWTDMNEVSNFCNDGGQGQVCENANPDKCPTLDLATQTDCCLVCHLEDDSNRYDFPPYAINNDNAQQALGHRTHPASALHYNAEDGGKRTRLSYDVHNLFGLLEARITAEALTDIRGERPFVLSRSTFPSHGAHAAHWTGDNAATWDDLKASTVTVMNMNLFGIPMIGSDMCGFLDNTTEELCGRWMALGAFHPFSRNHNTIGAAPQEPYLWESVAAVSRAALGLRYRLLPYLYTLFYGAHEEGDLVAKPLWASFGADAATHSLDEQFLLGDGILVSPALYEGQTSVSAYFPTTPDATTVWYSLSASAKGDDASKSIYGSEKFVVPPGGGFSQDLATPLTSFNVHCRSGVVFALHGGGGGGAVAAAATTTALVKKAGSALSEGSGAPPLTTVEARALPYEILVALDWSDDAASAAGSVFLDDGTQPTLDRSTVVSYAATSSGSGAGTLSARLVGDDGYRGAADAAVGALSVLGVSAKPDGVTITFDNQMGVSQPAQRRDDSTPTFTYDGTRMLLTVDLGSSNVMMNQEFTVVWK